jgi:predicted nuclease of predicted toxin-antitoxin system
MPSKKIRLRLYADECFPVPSVSFLRSKSVSIIHAFDKKFIHKSDRFHLKTASNLKRVLITLDRDFIGYEENAIKKTNGVIVISVGSSTPNSINVVSVKALRKISTEFAKGSLVKVTMDKVIRIKNGQKTEISNL